jgi:hypothetical protein
MSRREVPSPKRAEIGAYGKQHRKGEQAARTHQMTGTVSRSRNSMEVTYAPRSEHSGAALVFPPALRCDHERHWYSGPPK